MSCQIEACEKPAKKRNWCYGHYRRWLRHGDPLAGGTRYTGTVEERLWPRVEKSDNCWLWTGNRNSQGYGMITVGHGSEKTPALVHRIVWELTNDRKIPAGLVVMHACDTPLCVRPDHLSVGTQSQNIKDCYARGRR